MKNWLNVVYFLFWQVKCIHCEGILTPSLFTFLSPMSMDIYLWMYWNWVHAPLSDNFHVISFLSSLLLLFTPFKLKIIIFVPFFLFVYHLFRLYDYIFSYWTHAFDYNFRKRYCQSSDINWDKKKLWNYAWRKKGRPIQFYDSIITLHKKRRIITYSP